MTFLAVSEVVVEVRGLKHRADSAAFWLRESDGDREQADAWRPRPESWSTNHRARARLGSSDALSNDIWHGAVRLDRKVLEELEEAGPLRSGDLIFLPFPGVTGELREVSELIEKKPVSLLNPSDAAFKSAHLAPIQIALLDFGGSVVPDFLRESGGDRGDLPTDLSESTATVARTDLASIRQHNIAMVRQHANALAEDREDQVGAALGAMILPLLDELEKHLAVRDVERTAAVLFRSLEAVREKLEPLAGYGSTAAKLYAAVDLMLTFWT